MKYAEGSAGHLLAEAFGFNVGQPWWREQPKKRSGVRKPRRSRRTHGLKFVALMQHRPMKEWAYKPGEVFKVARAPLRTTATADERHHIVLRLNPPGASQQLRMTPRQVARVLGLTTKAVRKAVKLERRS